jgi:hypothetical protein
LSFLSFVLLHGYIISSCHLDEPSTFIHWYVVFTQSREDLFFLVKCWNLKNKQWFIWLQCDKKSSLTGSPLLICHNVGDMKKPHHRSHASDPMPWIFNNMINIPGRLWLFLTNQITCNKQSL